MTQKINFCQIGHQVIDIEQKAIANMLNQLDQNFQSSCELMLNCQGKTIVIGMGKSGHIAKKIAATLASTGTPAFFVHPAEASHGDLGMLTKQDVVLAISYSGETDEILNLLPVIRLLKLPLITITGNPNSKLSQAAHFNLNVHVTTEACPLGLAPTCSTTATLVMGDAIAISLLRARGFSSNDFARIHPSGALGRRLLMCVADLMHSKEQMPKVPPHYPIAQALMEITQKRLGMTIIVDHNNKLMGIFTDGDLRRTLDDGYDIHTTPIEVVMTRNCATITASVLATDAFGIMQQKKITSLPVVDEHHIPVGVLHMHDLLQAGVA